MAAGVMGGHVIVQSGVHASGSQSIGDGKQAELPELAAQGISENSYSGESHADRCDQTGTEPLGQAVTHKAGKGGAAGDDHINEPGS